MTMQKMNKNSSQKIDIFKSESCRAPDAANDHIMLSQISKETR